MTTHATGAPRHAARLCLHVFAIITCLGHPAVAGARGLLVVSPGGGNETMLAAGVIRDALAAGDSVTIAVATRGGADAAEASLHEGEAVAAAAALGLPEQRVIFLGYGAGILNDLYFTAAPGEVLTSALGESQTSAGRGLGGTDFHTHRTGAPAPYTRDAFAADLRDLVLQVVPDDIYTTSNFDEHPDHQALGRFLSEALAALRRAGPLPPIRLFQGIVWVPDGLPLQEGKWPQLDPGGFTPWLPFTEPGCCLDTLTQLDWERLRHLPVPAEMQSADPAANTKLLALQEHASLVSAWLTSFARKDEIFWLSDSGANLAFTASVSFSSEDWWPHGGLKAVDGVVDGWPRAWTSEWVSGELDGPWIQLDWAEPVVIAEVNLYDRPDPTENVLAGTLTFSDGSAIAVGPLPPHGQLLPVTFPPRTVSWVRFTIDRAEGSLSGLSEIEALGRPASSARNLAPHLLRGPIATPSSIYATETSLLQLEAVDLDGDPLQVTWTSDGGTVEAQGDGAVALFRPPAVLADTIFTLTATISDGRGGAERSSVFVTVRPVVVQRLTLNYPRATIGTHPTTTGTVVLALPAPAGGLAVPLASSQPAVVVPGSVTVPAGATSATFPVTMLPEAAGTVAILSAGSPGAPITAALTVLPATASCTSCHALHGGGGCGLPYLLLCP